MLCTDMLPKFLTVHESVCVCVCVCVLSHKDTKTVTTLKDHNNVANAGAINTYLV